MSEELNVVTEHPAAYELSVVDLDPLRAAIRAAGEFDLAARDDLTRVLQDQEDAGRRLIALDLSQVSFLDCSCLGVLATWHERLLARHGVLILSGVEGHAARVLKLTGLENSLFILPADRNPVRRRAEENRLKGPTPAAPVEPVLVGRVGLEPTTQGL